MSIKITPRFACPCCGESSLSARGEFEICPICLWEDDPLQSEDPHFDGGGNGQSLSAARRLWAVRHAVRPFEEP